MFVRIAFFFTLAVASVHAGVVKVFFVNGGRLHATHKGCVVDVDRNVGAAFKVVCEDKVFMYSTNTFGFAMEINASEVTKWER